MIPPPNQPDGDATTSGSTPITCAIRATTDLADLQRQLPNLARVFFEMIATEPLCGVGLVSSRGEVFYMNDQGAKHIAGERAVASDLVGRSLGEFFPAIMMEQRLEIFRRVGANSRPILVRTLWNGKQLTTWFRRVEVLAEIPGQAMVIALSRLISGDLRTLFPAEAVDLIESTCVRLGALDPLSSQELRVMALIGTGMSVRAAAKALFRAEKTIESHCSSIHAKLGVRDRVDVAKLAQGAGLTLEDADRTRV